MYYIYVNCPLPFFNLPNNQFLNEIKPSAYGNALSPQRDDKSSGGFKGQSKCFVTNCNFVKKYWCVFVQKKLSHRSSWQANHAISPKQNVFGKVHTMHIFKSLQENCISPHFEYNYKQVCSC